jgi:CHASE2 domain/CHAT domain
MAKDLGGAGLSEASGLQLRLEVQRLGSDCYFRLLWEDGRQLAVRLPDPDFVIRAYDQWRRAYLDFYAHLGTQNPLPAASSQGIRGTVLSSGLVKRQEPPPDGRLRLVEAQVVLLQEFHRWLGAEQLLSLRTAIAQTRETARSLRLLLICHDRAIDRLPWEQWNLLEEFGIKERLWLARCPVNVLEPTLTAEAKTLGQDFLLKRCRVLAIFGQAPGLNFDVEMAALKALEPALAVTFVGLPAESGDAAPIKLWDQVREKLQAKEGWDYLFFAGHSNENTVVAGGQLALGPNESILLNEWLPVLKVAKERGLKFAIFNSCSGLDIAQGLIGIGLNQVVIMREKVHNSVASAFFVQFSQYFAQGHEVHAALQSACGDLAEQQGQTYPAAALVPSLFRHPKSSLIRLVQPRPWQSWWAKGRPSRREGLWLGACLGLSLLPPIQGTLLDTRSHFQAFYRQVTRQVPAAGGSPILLVQIDQAVRENNPGLFKENVTDRAYLANVINQLTDRGVRVIGIDYLFNKASSQDAKLAQAINGAIDRQGSWFVLAQALKNGEKLGVASQTQLGSAKSRLFGCLNIHNLYHLLLPGPRYCESTAHHFSHMLAIAALSDRQASPGLTPQLTATTDLQPQLLGQLRQDSISPQLLKLGRLRQSHWSGRLGQFWFQPSVDYSVPPDAVFTILSAHDFSKQMAGLKLTAPAWQSRIVILASDGYDDTGMQDRFELPGAIGFWQQQGRADRKLSRLTGGEVLAYSTAHFLGQQKWVITVPDFLLLLLVGLLAKGLKSGPSNIRPVDRVFPVGIYMLASWQIYITAGLILPILLPTVLWLGYLWPDRQRDRSRLP